MAVLSADGCSFPKSFSNANSSRPVVTGESIQHSLLISCIERLGLLRNIVSQLTDHA